MARNKSNNNNTPTETVIEKAVAVEEKKANVTAPIKTSDPAPRVGAKLAEGKASTMRIYINKRTPIYKTPSKTSSSLESYAAASSEFPVFLKLTTPSGTCYQVGTKRYIFSSADVVEK